MTPNELYATTPVKTDDDLSVLFGHYYNHMPETGIQNPLDFPVEGINNESIKVRYYKYRHYDGRRFWRLASLWIDDKPFMIIQNAGREGDDYVGRFITDVELYKQAVSCIKALLPAAFREIADVINGDTDITNLTAFYGDSL